MLDFRPYSQQRRAASESKAVAAMVLVGQKTVRAGERAAVWSKNGSFRLVDGPQRVTLFRQKLEKLRQHTADQTQYLAVHKSTGVVEIHAGPCTLFFTPVEDSRIELKPANVIDASQAIIVSSNSTKLNAGDSLLQRVVRGPARFIPAAGEWVDQTIRETTADQNSYIEVRKRTGEIEVFPGPCSMFIDPLVDVSIDVKKAHNIDASEALVVCQQLQEPRRSIRPASASAADTCSSTRLRLVRGPARFIPAAVREHSSRSPGLWLFLPSHHQPTTCCSSRDRVCHVLTERMGPGEAQGVHCRWQPVHGGPQARRPNRDSSWPMLGVR